MIRFANSKKAIKLLNNNKQSFGLFNAIMHYIRTAMNKVRWEENQQFTSIEKRANNVPKTAEQATQLFIATEQQVSLSEHERMKRIDSVFLF